MIPAGRTAVDLAGIAELHGLSLPTARKERPWNKEGHPAPIAPSSGRPRRGHPRLWDREQAAAFAQGRPIPALPEPGDPLDLLDLVEAAELAGMKPATWDRYDNREQTLTRPEGEPPLVPPPDETVCDVAHWYRRTVEHYRADREARARAPRGGRPRGSPDRMSRSKIAGRVAELVDQARQRGETPNVAAIARDLGIAYTTAHTHVRRLTDTPH